MNEESVQPIIRDGLELAEAKRSLPISLLRTRETVMQRFRPMLQAHDVTEQQWRILRILFESAALDATMLAERACVLAPSLTRMIRSLETRGLIETRRDEHDRRRSLVALTPAGEQFLRGIAPLSAKIYAQIEAEVGAERIQRLLDDLDAFRQALSKE